jgi:hypothetical protein
VIAVIKPSTALGIIEELQDRNDLGFSNMPNSNDYEQGSMEYNY